MRLTPRCTYLASGGRAFGTAQREGGDGGRSQTWRPSWTPRREPSRIGPLSSDSRILWVHDPAIRAAAFKAAAAQAGAPRGKTRVFEWLGSNWHEYEDRPGITPRQTRKVPERTCLDIGNFGVYARIHRLNIMKISKLQFSSEGTEARAAIARQVRTRYRLEAHQRR